MGVDESEGTDSMGPGTGVGKAVVVFIVSNVGDEVVGNEVGWTGLATFRVVQPHEVITSNPKLNTSVNKSLTNIL